MASKKKQKVMVFHHEGPTTPAAAPAADHPPACYIVPKPGKASEGGMERSTRVTNEEVDMMGKPNVYPSKEAIGTLGELPAVKHPTSSNLHSDNLSPESICKGIRVMLDNNTMWNEFFRCKTEMILTKQGSRMFPYCRFRISGLQPSRKYSLIMDIQPLDNSRYKWTGKSWQVVGKAECQVKNQPFAHPDSPLTGQHWMQNPVSFYKLKLTNNISDQEGNTILQPMHRYFPRLHIIQTDRAAKDIKLNGPGVVTFTFPQTEFMAVTAYQNSRFAQLKVDCNPFAKGLKEDRSSLWGLKLKLNSGKDLYNDGDATTSDQHPMKKSLKSLLENHKPRSSKAADSKPAAVGDLQKNSTTNKNQLAAKVTGESLCCSSRPAQKLFSELIREAHVSLQRCNLEQLGINNSTSHKTDPTNTKTTALISNREDVPKKDSISVKTHSETSAAKKAETVIAKRNIKEEKQLLSSLNCKDNIRTDYSEVSIVAPQVNQKSSVNQQPKPESPPEGNVKKHKRPAPLPLPALALFLKQHSTKSKKAMCKPDSPLPALPLESVSGSQSSATASACLPSNHASNATSPSKDLTCDVTKSNNQASGRTGADVHTCEIVLNVTGQTNESALQPSSPSCPDPVANTEPKGPITDDQLPSISIAESPCSDPVVPDDTPVLPYLDQPFCTLGTSTSTISSTLATSSASPILSLPLDTVLHALSSPQTPTITESSTLLSDSPTTTSHSLPPDPECLSFAFEPLLPTGSSEPLPPLPASLALELESTTSEPTPKAVPPEELQQSEDSTESVFKWHTMLPPPEPCMDASFSTFQPTSEALPLASIASPLLPFQTPSHSETQTLDASPSTPPPDPAPSFQENEQSLPFPAELSPLALQLPLSPTFSSLDGDGLSPTPSITDLVHFFSTDDDLGIGVEFSNTEAVAVTCPSPTTIEPNENDPFQQIHPIPAHKPSKYKKKSRRRRKLAKMDMDQKTNDVTYTTMQPNLEEVEEQLFISFTSKEALKLHIADPSEGAVTQPQTTLEVHLPSPADTPENEGLEQTFFTCEKTLLRDLKLMKHKQVIHPVLQEVGLKMNLLDPTLAIDLRYLGVHLPIPPPGVSLEPLAQELPPSQGVCAAFVSRTGKTTDVTQIKGWREKYTPSEAPSTPSSTKPEAGPGPDLPKKNLSAFCSDMLDEYLENEGKLIDERAESFSQPLVEPIVYELPTRSTSYVRTLDSILKKHTVSSPTSDLIYGFVPPSKRPKLSLKETKNSRRGERKQKGPKLTKFRPEPAAAPVSTPKPNPAEPNAVPKQPLVLTPALPPPSEHTAPIIEPPKSKKNQLKVRFSHTEQLTLSPLDPAFKKRKKLKPKTSSLTLSPPRSTANPLDVSEDLAPLESDSELRTSANQGDETHKNSRPVMTRALLRQKELEDSVLWEGKPRTSITRERAAIALTSLFTLKGFVSENPTAPIQLIRKRPPPCLNEFCRLGCVCSSLSHCSRISHCGRPHCMFGCSCLKQKVVLLKNLDGSDSSPSHHGNTKKRRRRRMKMAYILKEADSVSQPAERVRILWKRDVGESDVDPIHVPEPAPFPRSIEVTKDVKPKALRLKSLKQRDLTLKEAKTSPSRPPPAEDSAQPPPPDRPQSPPSEPNPKPSKRLIILAECTWASDADRNHVLKRLCEAMAQDRLDDPFWIRKYLISPISQTVEESGSDRCIQYKIHISRPRLEREKPAASAKPQRLGNQRKEKPQEQQQEDHLRQVNREAEPLKDWPRELMEEEEPLEDWQREVEEGDIQEEEGSTLHQVDDGRKRSGRKIKTKPKKKMLSMALPFLTGISPAGFLSANRKQPGGTDHLVQVNGKLYPLAKIQLGKMGALHPANRLAAYLTGRVGSNGKQQGSPSSSSPSSKPPQTQSPGTVPQTVFSASSNFQTTTTTTTTARPRPQPSVTVLTLPNPLTVSQRRSSVVHPVNPHPGSGAVTGPHMKVPVWGLAPQLPPPPPPSDGQRMVLQPVQTASGAQYYRIPDGKLVQLVPISKLRPVNSNLPVRRGPSSPSVLPLMSVQSPAVTVTQTLPQTSVTTSTVTTPSSSSSSPLSGLGSFSMSPLPAPLYPGFLSQKGTCTFKILPTNSNKEPIIITCPKLPSLPPAKGGTAPSSITLLHSQPHPPTVPVNLISLKPSAGQGAELGVKTLAVSAVPVAPDGMLVPQKPASSQTHSTSQSPAEKAPRAPPPISPAGSEVTPPHPPYAPVEPELACDLVDLDIVCVDDETRPITTETQSTEVVDLVGSSSGETENSSDFGDDSYSEDEKETVATNHRHIHNMLERKRRVRMLQLFNGLRREMGLSDKRITKDSTLKKAVQMIQELRTTETDLKKKKRRLMKRRDVYLSTLAPRTDKSRQVISIEYIAEQRAGMAGKTGPDLMEVDLLELMENSSDEDGVDEKETSVAIACQRIQTLQTEMEELKGLKKLLDQGGTYITEIPPRSAEQSGKGEQRVLRKLQRLSSKQKKMEKQEGHRAANQLPVAPGDGGSEPPLARGGASDVRTGDRADDDIIITSSNLQQRQSPQTAPVPVSVPPTTTPVHTPVQPPVQQPQRVSQVSRPVSASPAASHNAVMGRDRPRTIPNILSRSKNPAPPSTLFTKTAEGEAQSIHALVPAEVLSLVGAALPRPPVLTLSSMMAGPAVLQTTPTPGVASVTLNIPSLINQQIHLTSLPRPPTGKIYSSPAPLTVTKITDTNFNNLLHLVQPAPPLQQLPTDRQQVLAGQPPAPPPRVVSARTEPSSDQIKDQDQSLSWSHTKLGCSSSSPQPSTQDPSSSLCPGLSADHWAEVRVRGDPGPEQQPETRGDSGTSTLTSLLSEIVFLNQQTVSAAATGGVSAEADAVPGGGKERLHAHNPWLLHLDQDSDDTITTEMELWGRAGAKHAPPQTGPANGSTKGGGLAPPPLLQMKVGGAKSTVPTSSDESAAGGGSRRGGKMEGGVAWRPMPRLVPLGLRGNPPS